MALPQLKAEDIASWLTPIEAVRVLSDVYGDNWLAKDTLLGRLRSGTVQAVAEKTVVYGAGSVTYETHRIYSDEWKRIETTDNGWITGDFRYSRRNSSGFHDETVNNHGVKFEPQSVRDIIKNIAPVSAPKTAQIRPGSLPPGSSVLADGPVPNKGGRPAKAWWQDFWVEMCCRVFDGSIHPTATQAAIQEQMHQWVSDHDHEAGETVLKEAAKKLSQALKGRSET